MPHVGEPAGPALHRFVRRVVPGTAMQWAHYWRRWLHSRRPSTFNSKVFYKMLRDRRPLLVTFVDKVAVRDYVERMVGPEVLRTFYAVMEDPRDLHPATLPSNFVVKASHGSSGMVMVWDGADPGSALPPPGAGWTRTIVHPDRVDWNELMAVCTHWLELRYGDPRGEWAYAQVPPRILVEELLLDETGNPPRNVKFSVFNGVVRLVQISELDVRAPLINYYLPDWTPVPMEWAHGRNPDEHPPPRALARMIEIAERLGSETDFVRVDLHEVGDRIIFGELTNWPEAGVGRFKPRRYNRVLGSWWQLPEQYV